jgi:DNA-directed RNA polymerase specialized sigma24 family protein
MPPHPRQTDTLGDHLLNEAEIVEAAPASGPLDATDRVWLSAAIEKLPAKQRWAIGQRFALGLSVAELAAARGCKVVGAKKSISRALEALRTIYLGTSLK